MNRLLLSWSALERQRGSMYALSGTDLLHWNGTDDMTVYWQCPGGKPLALFWQ